MQIWKCAQKITWLGLAFLNFKVQFVLLFFLTRSALDGSVTSFFVNLDFGNLLWTYSGLASKSRLCLPGLVLPYFSLWFEFDPDRYLALLISVSCIKMSSLEVLLRVSLVKLLKF